MSVVCIHQCAFHFGLREANLQYDYLIAINPFPAKDRVLFVLGQCPPSLVEKLSQPPETFSLRIVPTWDWMESGLWSRRLHIVVLAMGDVGRHFATEVTEGCSGMGGVHAVPRKHQKYYSSTCSGVMFRFRIMAVLFVCVLSFQKKCVFCTVACRGVFSSESTYMTNITATVCDIH